MSFRRILNLAHRQIFRDLTKTQADAMTTMLRAPFDHEMTPEQQEREKRRAIAFQAGVFDQAQPKVGGQLHPERGRR